MKLSKASLLLMALAGCSLIKQEQPSFLFEAQKGLGYTVQIAEPEAEYELQKLARTSPVEADWLYVNGRLIDVGIEELADQTFTATDRILKECKLNQRLTLYHVHQGKNSTPISPPSGRDIQLYVRLKKEVEQRGASLEEKVIDSEGIWTIHVDRNMTDAIYNAHRSSNGAFQEKFNRIMKDLVLTTIHSWNYSSDDDAIGAFIDGAAQRGVILEYQNIKQQ